MITMLSTEQTNETATAWFVRGSAILGGQAELIPIPSGRFQVGRRSDNNLCIPHPNVSKLHAEFVASEIALFVRDLGSTNGTLVNGKRITEDTPVGEDDIVHFANFEFFVGRVNAEDSMRTMVSTPTEWQSSLAQFHQLLTERAVVPYFQRIMRFSDRQTIGYEVLARSAVPGLMNPKDMFAAAERCHLAARLSVMCRENGVEAAKKLAHPGQIFLNTHPCERPHDGLTESLMRLRSSAPDLEIVLELHEAAVTNPKEIAEFRRVLKELRIQLAYDDFGAGQARLMELSEVAPDYLKFDIGLVRGIDHAPKRQRVVAGLVQLVRELGIQAVAEGIETVDEAEVCRQIGFTHAQGYFYGKPAPLESTY